ncbi:MAG: hypothetical protein GXP59_01715 [Deltaproteobacteria bacterium]|nr:hypothetical protein [Deltaproteobacteria bacterium]
MNTTAPAIFYPKQIKQKYKGHNNAAHTKTKYHAQIKLKIVIGLTNSKAAKPISAETIKKRANAPSRYG